MFAIVKTGGKQYRVGPGDQIVVERIAGDVGTEVAIKEVLLIGGDGANTIGRPTVANASVVARIVQQPRGGKIIVFKKKRRKNYRRKHGHRQELTVLRIEQISTGAETAPVETTQTESSDAQPEA
jgi:large subunit ribosomal protein L21